MLRHTSTNSALLFFKLNRYETIPSFQGYLSQIEQVEINRADGDGDEHDGECHQEVFGERNLFAVDGCHAGYYYVGAGADQGTVAAQAGAERECPPERLEIRHAHSAHVLDHRDQGSYERYVVDEGRSDGAEPEDEHRRAGEVAGCEGEHFLRHHLDDARFDEAADEDEEAGEEEDGEPFDAAEDAGDFIFARGHADEHQQAGTGHSYGRAFEVELGVHGEGDDDESQHKQAFFEQARLFDLFLFIHGHDLRLKLRRGDELLAVDQQQYGHGNDEDDDADAGQIRQEGHEVHFRHG